MSATASAVSVATDFRDTDHFLDAHPIGSRVPGGFVGGAHPVLRRGVIVVAPKQFEIRAPWTKAMKRAAEVEVDGMKDYRLLGRLESLVIFENLSQDRTAAAEFKADGAEAFERDWYWTGEEFGSVCAWGQGFGGGGSARWGKLNDLRVRPARIVLI